MFYRTSQPHGLRHDPFNAIIVPRPIGWVSSLNERGEANLAPYSFFNAVAYTPPQVIFAVTAGHRHGGLKDSVRNIQATGEFVVNLATWALREAVNTSSVAAPHGVDEFELAGLGKQASVLVAPPRVAQSPVHLECRHIQTIELLAPDPVDPNLLVLGEVLGVHIDESVITDGLVDIAKLQPIGRLGYHDYVHVSESFQMIRPKWPLDKTAAD